MRTGTSTHAISVNPNVHHACNALTTFTSIFTFRPKTAKPTPAHQDGYYFHIKPNRAVTMCTMPPPLIHTHSRTPVHIHTHVLHFIYICFCLGLHLSWLPSVLCLHCLVGDVRCSLLSQVMLSCASLLFFVTSCFILKGWRLILLTKATAVSPTWKARPLNQSGHISLPVRCVALRTVYMLCIRWLMPNKSRVQEVVAVEQWTLELTCWPNRFSSWEGCAVLL